MEEGFAGKYAEIKNDFTHPVEKLKQTMISVILSTSAIQSGAQDILAAADDLSRRGARQAASLAQTAVALDEINKAIHPMDRATPQNATMVEEATAAHALSEETAQLAGLVGRFHAGRLDEAAPRQALRKRGPHVFENSGDQKPKNIGRLIHAFRARRPRNRRGWHLWPKELWRRRLGMNYKVKYFDIILFK